MILPFELSGQLVSDINWYLVVNVRGKTDAYCAFLKDYTRKLYLGFPLLLEVQGFLLPQYDRSSPSGSIGNSCTKCDGFQSMLFNLQRWIVSASHWRMRVQFITCFNQLWKGCSSKTQSKQGISTIKTGTKSSVCHLSHFWWKIRQGVHQMFSQYSQSEGKTRYGVSSLRVGKENNRVAVMQQLKSTTPLSKITISKLSGCSGKSSLNCWIKVISNNCGDEI